MTELDLPKTMQTNFPDPADLLNFSLKISPDEGKRTLISHPFDLYARRDALVHIACSIFVLSSLSSMENATCRITHPLPRALRSRA